MSNWPFNNKFFTKEMKKALSDLVKSNSECSEIVVKEAGNVVLRTKVLSAANYETFAMYTSAQPNDKIIYSTDLNSAVLPTQN